MGGDKSDDQNGTNLKQHICMFSFFFFFYYSTNNNLQIDRLCITYTKHVQNRNRNHVETRCLRQDASRALGLQYFKYSINFYYK